MSAGAKRPTVQPKGSPTAKRADDGALDRTLNVERLRLACGINSALVSRRPLAAAQLERRGAASHLDLSRPPGGLVVGEDLAVGEAGALAGAGEAGVVIAGHGLERVRMDEGVKGRFGLELVDHHVLPGLGAHVVTVERNGLVAAHGEEARHA